MAHSLPPLRLPRWWAELQSGQALMSILFKNGWLTRERIIEKLRLKGFERGDKTIKRLLSMLKEIKFNLMTDSRKAP